MTQLDAPALLDQLLALEGLDRLPRTGYLQRGVSDPESVAEHSWHVATLAWTLLPHAQPLDERRVLELALFHDVGELLIGDIPRPARDLFPEGAKRAAESRAMRDILAGSGSRAAELADELDRGSSVEARFVHHCDRLQLLVKTATYARWREGACSEFLEELLSSRPDGEADAQFAVFDELRVALARRDRDRAKE